MSMSGLDLNLVCRAGAGRGGLVVTVAPDPICGKGAAAAANPADELLWRPIQVAPDRNFVPMEGDPSRAPCPAEISDYGRFRLAELVGARIDLQC